MQLRISLRMPEKHESRNHPYLIKSIEDKVRESLDLIDSGYCSHVEWLMINKLYKQLKQMTNRSDRVTNLINMIDAVMRKYGYHGVGIEG